MAKKLITIEFKDGETQHKVDADTADRRVKMFPKNWKIVDDYRDAKPKEKRETIKLK